VYIKFYLERGLAFDAQKQNIEDRTEQMPELGRWTTGE
jgi:hypothetical protein